jgi:IS5 family transposase
LSKVVFRINKKKGADRKRKDRLLSDPVNRLEYAGQPDRDGRIEYMKPKVRCKAERVFAIAKGKFGYRKTACRGLKKNPARLYMLFCGANLLRRSWPAA